MNKFVTYIKRGIKYIFKEYKQPIIKANIVQKATDNLFNGRVYLVTGGSSGIGYYIAKKLIQEGASVIITGRNEQKLKNAKNQLGNDCIYMVYDIKKIDDADKIFNEIYDEFGRIDVLVNNAGISEQKMINDISETDWDNMFSVNVKGAFNCTKAVLDNMIHNKYGRIINISSMWGITGASCEVHYSATKAALIGFTKALDKELGPSGITVNCVAPGLVDTDMNSSFSKETIEEIVNETPVMRIGTGNDVAESVAFLSSDDAGFITGQVLSVNGGLVI